MSFNVHKRKALDAALPFNHRMSNLRSCAMLVSQKFRVPRSMIITRVAEQCGVDITLSANDAEIHLAVAILEQIKQSGLGDSD